MKKTLKTMLGAVCAVTMLTEAVMPISAADETDNNIAEFKAAYSEMTEKAVDYVVGFQQLTEDDFYEVWIEQPDGTLLFDGYRTDYGEENTRVFKAPNGRYYLSGVTDKNIGEAKIKFFTEKFEAFDTKTVDEITYITLDGVDYEYYFNLDEENGVIDFYMNRTYSEIAVEMKNLFAEYLTAEDTLYSCIEKCFEFTSSDIFMFEIGLLRCRSIRENSDNPDMSMDDLKIVLAVMETAESVNYINALSSSDEKIQLSESLSNVIYDDEFHENIYCNPYKYLRGDLDGNGEINVKDLSILKQYLINETELLPIQKRIVSTSGSDDLDIRDVTKIAQYIVKLIDEL